MLLAEGTFQHNEQHLLHSNGHFPMSRLRTEASSWSQSSRLSILMLLRGRLEEQRPLAQARLPASSRRSVVCVLSYRIEVQDDIGIQNGATTIAVPSTTIKQQRRA